MAQVYKTLFGIESDNFDLYFEKQLTGITESGRELMPKDLSVRVFRFDGSLNKTKISKLGFLERIFILWRCLKKRIWIIVEDEEGGMNPEEFAALHKSIKRRDFGVSKAQDLTTQATFITGNRELCDTFQYLNNISASPAYTYFNKTKNFRHTKTADFRMKMEYIVKVFRFYEANKKGWSSGKKISIPEFYVLLFLYDKTETPGAIMHREFYKRAFQSSPSKIKGAYRLLETKGYITQRGSNSGLRLSITAMGIDLVNSILMNYALKC